MSRRFQPTERWSRALEEAPPEVRQTVANILAAVEDAHPVGPEGGGNFTAREGDVIVSYSALADFPLIILLDLIWIERDS